ncbi:MAG: hypothetical protein ACF8PN_06165 [Phycisphaerales bacterium]
MASRHLYNSDGEPIAVLDGDRVLTLSGEYYGDREKDSGLVIRDSRYLGEIVKDRYLLFHAMFREDCDHLYDAVPGYDIRLRRANGGESGWLESPLYDLEFCSTDAPVASLESKLRADTRATGESPFAASVA